MLFVCVYISLHINFCVGCAVAQAVSHWFPTSAPRVRVRTPCGVCGGQRSTGAGFLRVLRFPLPIIPPISPSPWAGTIGLLVVAVPSGPWIPPPNIPHRITGVSDFIHRPDFNNYEKKNKHDVSKTGSVSVLR
jgi:hypothetical protein